MPDITSATWALAAATLLLVVLSFLQYLKSRDAVAGQDRGTKVLEDQARALAATAKANQAVADEMLAARQSENPLELTIEDSEPTPGMLAVSVERAGAVGIVILSAEILVGFADAEVQVWRESYSNNYLGAGIERFYVRQSLGQAPGDVVRLLITGRPQGGVPQVHETLFRIPPNEPPVQLSMYRTENWSTVA